jgi:Ca-activated chloride channel family protein
MLAEDVTIADQSYFVNYEYPNRLNRGKLEILRLISQLKGERIGMFFFAYSGTSIVDLTPDYDFAKYILVNADSLDLAFTGSNIDRALRTGASMFEVDSVYKILVLVSDGELEDLAQMGLIVAEAKKLREDEIIVHAISTGENKEVMIPKRHSSHEVDWFRNREGNLLTTKMNEPVLKKIVSVTGGNYYHAEKSRLVADDVIRNILEDAKHVRAIKRPATEKIDLTPFFLFALLLVWLFWEFLILIRLR